MVLLQTNPLIAPCMLVIAVLSNPKYLAISTNEATLKIENYFVDGDTRTITLKNPKSSITTSEIQNLEAYISANSLLIGDRYAGTFGKIGTVTRVTEQRTEIDLS